MTLPDLAGYNPDLLDPVEQAKWKTLHLEVTCMLGVLWVQVWKYVLRNKVLITAVFIHPANPTEATKQVQLIL